MKKIYLSLLLIINIIFISSCKKDDSSINKIEIPIDSTNNLPGWELVWSDEFSATSIDKNKWEHEVNGDGGGNNELQYYSSRSSNSFIDSGKLVIQALKESYLGKNYTSARMRTKNKGDWKYGRFDIKAKLPFGQGLWPAIWMLPTDWEYGSWPLSGEIDIMEMLGHQTSKVYGTIHFGPAWPNNQNKGGSYILQQGTFVNNYHLFTVEWDSVGFKWFVDGYKFFSTNYGKPFDKRFHILLNVAVGGNWPGSPNEYTFFPQQMYIDYVRVYRKK